jgi:hypothetical protein
MATPVSVNEGVRIIGDFTVDAINDIAAQEKLTKVYGRTKRRSPARARSRKVAERRRVQQKHRD